MSVKNIKKKEEIDKIKANWDIGSWVDPYGNEVKLPEEQQLLLHFLDKIEELELRIKALEGKT